ncbi:MAG: hypothetical protein ABI459_05170, partial [Deltaproteobacteria bacterium]
CVKVTINAGQGFDDPQPLPFEIAARAAMLGALRQAGPILLEPILRIEIATPREFAIQVIGDLTSRRGQVTTTNRVGECMAISALVPGGTLFGYQNSLLHLTNGVGKWSALFDHYAPVPSRFDGPDDFAPAVGKRA